MRADDLRKLFKNEPFKPFKLGLSDGRSVLIRHPDQAVVSQRHLYVGLAKIQRSKPLTTPRAGNTLASDWLLIDLVHIATAEPINGEQPTRRRSTHGRRGSDKH